MIMSNQYVFIYHRSGLGLSTQGRPLVLRIRVRNVIYSLLCQHRYLKELVRTARIYVEGGRVITAAVALQATTE
jgi:hypothetical protein